MGKGLHRGAKHEMIYFGNRWFHGGPMRSSIREYVALPRFYCPAKVAVDHYRAAPDVKSRHVMSDSMANFAQTYLLVFLNKLRIKISINPHESKYNGQRHR